MNEDKRKTPDQKAAAADQASQGDDQAGAPVYVARIKLEKSSIMVDGKAEPLGPGMAVSAEIKTGRRRVIDYLISPLRQYEQEALRER